MEKVTMRQVDGSELAAVEGGDGRALGLPGNYFALWNAINKNGGYVNPSGPLPAPPGPLDYRTQITGPDHIE